MILPNNEMLHKSVFHLYVIRTNKRNLLIQALKNSEIGYGIHYPKALPFLDAYKKFNFSKKDFPVAFKLQKEILSLPIYPELTKDQIFRIAKTLNNFK